LPSEFAYYIVCPDNKASRPKIVAFREWLLSEAAKDTQGRYGWSSGLQSTTV
jgi:DNA-binding transcriptional LysR family regulator